MRAKGRSGLLAICSAKLHGAQVAAGAIRSRLPPGWLADFKPGSGADGGLLTIRGTDGRRAKLRVISRKRVSPKDVPHIVTQADDPSHLLLVASFLNARARELLAHANASYIDATGNLRWCGGAGGRQAA